VHQIALKRSKVIVGVAVLEANFVVDSCVVYQCIELAEVADRLPNFSLSAAHALLIAAPIPFAPPVTRITLSCSRESIFEQPC